MVCLPLEYVEFGFGVDNMVGNRAMKRIVGPVQASFLLVLSILLCAGVLVSVGCQKGSSAAKPLAAGAEPPVTSKVRASPSRQQSAAPEKAPQSGQAVAGVPKIQIENRVQDFGNIGPETKHTTTFAFKNVGTAPLRIVRVKKCCGSVTRGVEEGQEYAPGKGGALEVEYLTGTYPGPLVRNLSIETNDPNEPEAHLTIKANVVFPVEHQPSRLELFARQENAGCGPITLESVDGQPFAITGFRSTANTITADFDPNVKATEFTLHPKADLEKLKRSPKGQVSIDLTHPELKNIRILYDVSPDFTISPPQLTLFNLKADEPIRRDIWVMSNYEKDFDIESVSSQRGSMKLIESKKVSPTPMEQEAARKGVKIGARYQLQIEITPPALEDKRSILSDVLEVKIKGGETLTLQCRGFYAAS
jgi:hypothetical protein